MSLFPTVPGSYKDTPNFYIVHRFDPDIIVGIRDTLIHSTPVSSNIS